ncbi:signal transduction histidine kinase [Streptosporangium album]|uniref:histidine kinase n=1 Tax=Streptosporangium album TaxID=47479 RepID=A0A7W7RY61_9ACTN|nr:sensor histidine kinase [Streptosporangium album]MBB4940431.1 signal transduction histidine kinase [Streptosporangium album]
MKDVTTPWQAITGNPLRFLGSPWPWRALAYLLTSLPGGGGVILVATMGRQTSLVVGMIMVLVVAGVLSGPIASVERWRLRLIDPVNAPASRQNPWTSFASPTAWREIGYAILWATILPVVNALIMTLAALTVISSVETFHSWLTVGNPVMPAGDPSTVVLLTVTMALVWLAGCAYLLTLVAAVQGTLTRSLLTAPPEERMIELTRSRARLVDAFEAERRRIERDLHDGTQLRLTAVLMQLGLAELDVREDPERTATAISTAYGHTQAALDELRRVIRDIHPTALTDRGLGVAVTELARHCQIPVTMDLRLPHRPPPGVEAAAYFCVSESLTNVVKHSKAQRITIKAELSNQCLTIEVGDDGIGGADPTAGSGINGLADRIGVLDGTLSLSSPLGGPTVIQVRIPCG